MGNNEHTIVYLIGMGPGNSDCLTREAVQALSQATVCIGASRMLAIWKSLCEEDGRDAEQTFYNAYKAEEIAELIQNHVGETIAVVFSGDIGFYSGAKKLSMMLRKAVGKVCNMVDDTTGTTEQIQADKTIYELCYIPGLSSVQYLFDYRLTIIFSFWNYAPVPDSSRRLYAQSSSFLHKHQSLTDR